MADLSPRPPDAFEVKAQALARAALEAAGDPHEGSVLLLRAHVILETEAERPAPEGPRRFRLSEGCGLRGREREPREYRVRW
jgi:hypothetical protein